MPNPPPTPTWQPIRKLPLIARHIDAWCEAVKEQYATLQQARNRPYVLDDATVTRVIQVFTTQRDDLWLFEEQLRRWGSGALTPAQRQEVERLEGQMQSQRETIHAVLALAEELHSQTIERLLEKSDLEVGLEALRRWGPDGTDGSQPRRRQP